MLAYSVVCHIGIMLAGIGLLDSSGLAGAELMFLAHALLTAGLFFVAGILHVGSRADRRAAPARPRPRLLGRRRRPGSRRTIGLVGTPYVGIYLGHGLIDEGATELGRPWVLALLWLGSALAGAALLRAGARIFLGWGDADDPLLGEAMEEDPLERDVLRPLLVGVALTAVVARRRDQRRARARAASRVRGRAASADRSGYAARVLHGRPLSPPPSLPVAVSAPSLESVLYGVRRDDPRARPRARRPLPAAAAACRLAWRPPHAGPADPCPPRAPQRRRRRLRDVGRRGNRRGGRRCGAPLARLSDHRESVATFAR